jgi:hypothetical protein
VSNGRLHDVNGRLHVSNGRLHDMNGRLYESYGVSRAAKRRYEGIEKRVRAEKGPTILNEARRAIAA